MIFDHWIYHVPQRFQVPGPHFLDMLVDGSTRINYFMIPIILSGDSDSDEFPSYHATKLYSGTIQEFQDHVV